MTTPNQRAEDEEAKQRAIRDTMNDLEGSDCGDHWANQLRKESATGSSLAAESVAGPAQWRELGPEDGNVLAGDEVGYVIGNQVEWEICNVLIGQPIKEFIRPGVFFRRRVSQPDATTPDSSLPPIGDGPRRKIVITIEVTEDFEKRLDNQWMVEREIHADRWQWKWADVESEAARELNAIKAESAESIRKFEQTPECKWADKMAHFFGRKKLSPKQENLVREIDRIIRGYKLDRDRLRAELNRLAADTEKEGSM